MGLAIALTSGSLALNSLPVPSHLQGWPPLVAGAMAQAQEATFSTEEIIGYANAVLEMDTPRTEAYDKIQALLTERNIDANAVPLTCTGTANLNTLPRNLRSSVRTIIVDYCNQASTIVQANGLTARQFNAITAAHPQDETLSEQIRTALIQLQQQSQGTAPAPSEATP
ncbi:MAG: DUF4168 domain-containing protein [Nodosilinea sp.]